MSARPVIPPRRPRSWPPRPLAAAALAVTLLGSCQSPTVSGDLPATPEIAVSAGRYRKEYVLAPGDSLDVVVRQHPEISRSCVVRPDGYITLPMVKDVKAAGLTFPELDRTLADLFGPRLKDPEIAVIATSVRPATVYVVGEVTTNGAVILRDAPTPALAIARSGGFKLSAVTDSVVVIRLEEDRIKAIKIDVSLSGQPAAYMALSNFPLMADDIVFVPKSAIAQLGDWLQDYVSKPLGGVNSLAAIYTNYLLIRTLQ